MFTWQEFQQEVFRRLEHNRKTHLRPLFKDLRDIGRRIREIDDTLFVVRNVRKKRFEVHSLEHRPDTFAWAVPWDELDGRVLEKARFNRIERFRDPAQYVDEENYELERMLERDRDRQINDAAREMHKAFRKTAYDKG